MSADLLFCTFSMADWIASPCLAFLGYGVFIPSSLHRYSTSIPVLLRCAIHDTQSDISALSHLLLPHVFCSPNLCTCARTEFDPPRSAEASKSLPKRGFPSHLAPISTHRRIKDMN